MRIACVLDGGFEDSELAVPEQVFTAAGHEVTVIGFERGAELKGKKGTHDATVALAIDAASPDDFDALLIPGGNSPDRLRAHDSFVSFTRAFADAGKPIFAICHGPQLLITADAIKGRRLTANKTVRDDLRRMGESVEDSEVVVDRQLVTSRTPADLDAFVRESLSLLSRVPA